jgi:hypothetical protein
MVQVHQADGREDDSRTETDDAVDLVVEERLLNGEFTAIRIPGHDERMLDLDLRFEREPPVECVANIKNEPVKIQDSASISIRFIIMKFPIPTNGCPWFFLRQSP